MASNSHSYSTVCNEPSSDKYKRYSAKTTSLLWVIFGVIYYNTAHLHFNYWDSLFLTTLAGLWLGISVIVSMIWMIIGKSKHKGNSDKTIIIIADTILGYLVFSFFTTPWSIHTTVYMDWLFGIMFVMTLFYLLFARCKERTSRNV